MIVKVTLFAQAKDIAESNMVEFELDNDATIADLKIALTGRFPNLRPLLNRSAFSVNQEYAQDSTPVSGESEIAMIPPVSGG